MIDPLINSLKNEDKTIKDANLCIKLGFFSSEHAKMGIISARKFEPF